MANTWQNGTSYDMVQNEVVKLIIGSEITPTYWITSPITKHESRLYKHVNTLSCDVLVHQCLKLARASSIATNNKWHHTWIAVWCRSDVLECCTCVCKHCWDGPANWPYLLFLYVTFPLLHLVDLFPRSLPAATWCTIFSRAFEFTKYQAYSLYLHHASLLFWLEYTRCFNTDSNKDEHPGDKRPDWDIGVWTWIQKEQRFNNCRAILKPRKNYNVGTCALDIDYVYCTMIVAHEVEFLLKLHIQTGSKSCHIARSVRMLCTRPPFGLLYLYFDSGC
jgi:hypothetical protein